MREPKYVTALRRADESLSSLWVEYARCYLQNKGLTSDSDSAETDEKCVSGLSDKVVRPTE